MGTGSNSKACAYIELSDSYGKAVWGVGIDTDIITASLNALISAANKISHM
ncbi:MAG: alpha-isopropylmalate synthase regulatory domain-containing protein [Oscillospiraceae bacterium]